MFYIITYFPSVASRTRPLCLSGSDCTHKRLVLGLGHAPTIQNGRGLSKRGVVYKNLRALRAHCNNVTPLSEILRTPLLEIRLHVHVLLPFHSPLHSDTYICLKAEGLFSHVYMVFSSKCYQYETRGGHMCTDTPRPGSKFDRSHFWTLIA
jgi:hypothetical protein